MADRKGGESWDFEEEASDEDDEEDPKDWQGFMDYEEEEMPSRSTAKKYKDKYSHESDSSDGEDPDLADDDMMVSTKTAVTRKRIPTKKRA